MHLPVDVHRHPRTGDHPDHAPPRRRGLTQQQAGELLRLSTAGGRVLADRINCASSFWARFRGLMGRRAVARDEGLYLPGTSSIHMLFMRFPIDCLFVGPAQADGTRKVVGVRRSLAPWRGLAWVRGAEGVVELAAGTLDPATIAQGDTVRLAPRAAEAEASGR